MYTFSDTCFEITSVLKAHKSHDGIRPEDKANVIKRRLQAGNTPKSKTAAQYTSKFVSGVECMFQHVWESVPGGQLGFDSHPPHCIPRTASPVLHPPYCSEAVSGVLISRGQLSIPRTSSNVMQRSFKRELLSHKH